MYNVFRRFSMVGRKNWKRFTNTWLATTTNRLCCTVKEDVERHLCWPSQLVWHQPSGSQGLVQSASSVSLAPLPTAVLSHQHSSPFVNRLLLYGSNTKIYVTCALLWLNKEIPDHLIMINTSNITISHWERVKRSM